MPPLLLDDDEAVAVGVGLRAAASGTVTGIEETSLRALTKLQQTLPARLRHRLDALRQATVSAAGGGPTVDAETISIIAGACRDHEQLRFDYEKRGGDAGTRRVEPHRLVYTGCASSPTGTPRRPVTSPLQLLQPLASRSGHETPATDRAEVRILPSVPGG